MGLKLKLIFYTGLAIQFTSGYAELFAFNHEMAAYDTKIEIAHVAEAMNLLP